MHWAMTHGRATRRHSPDYYIIQSRQRTTRASSLTTMRPFLAIIASPHAAHSPLSAPRCPSASPASASQNKHLVDWPSSTRIQGPSSCLEGARQLKPSAASAEQGHERHISVLSMGHAAFVHRNCWRAHVCGEHIQRRRDQLHLHWAFLRALPLCRPHGFLHAQVRLSLACCDEDCEVVHLRYVTAATLACLHCTYADSVHIRHSTPVRSVAWEMLQVRHHCYSPSGRQGKATPQHPGM